MLIQTQIFSCRTYPFAYIVLQLCRSGEGVPSSYVTTEAVDYLHDLTDFSCFGAVTVDGLFEGWRKLQDKLVEFRTAESLNHTHYIYFEIRLKQTYPVLVDEFKEKSSVTFTIDPKTAVRFRWMCGKMFVFEILRSFWKGLNPPYKIKKRRLEYGVPLLESSQSLMYLIRLPKSIALR